VREREREENKEQGQEGRVKREERRKQGETAKSTFWTGLHVSGHCNTTFPGICQ
jgi:hypothetical protein